MAPVHDHWYAERALLAVGLGDMHPPHRQGLPGRDGLVHPHRRRHPGRAVKSDDPVDPGRRAASIALGHLPHADQRVAPRPQHHFLQVPDLGPVPVPRRREDPLPQPRYVLLMDTPVHGVPLQPAFRSVHHHRCLTCPSVRSAALASSPHRLTWPRQLPFGPGISRYPAGYPRPRPGGGAVRQPWFPAAFRPPAFASRPSLPPMESSPSYDRPAGSKTPDHDGVSAFRTCEQRPEWAPSIPRDQRCSREPGMIPGPPPAASQRRGSCTPGTTVIYPGATA